MRTLKERFDGSALPDFILKLIHKYHPVSLKKLVTDCRSYSNYAYSYSVIRREIGRLIDSGWLELEPRGTCNRSLLKKGGLDRLKHPTAGHTLRSGNTMQLSLLTG
jgi:hypothetical protein